MKRRDFLKTGALAVAGTAAAITGLIPEVGADTVPAFKTLNAEQSETLLKMTRQIYPHRKLDDAAYWKVVKELDAAGEKDPAVANLLADGVAHLNSAQAAKFDALSEKEQIEALKNIQNTPFFQKVQSVELASLYNEPEVWKALGYEGPAYATGGYINHGFNDLAWLPNPPESASPKPA
jgi:hypothetical protein